MPTLRVALNPDSLLEAFIDEGAGVSDTLNERQRNRVTKAFERDPVEGLLLLAGIGLGEVLDPGTDYWRKIGQHYIECICHAHGLEHHWEDLEQPEFEITNRWEEKAPKGEPQPDEEFFVHLWEQLNAVAGEAAMSEEGGLKRWLKQKHPIYQQLGKVTFHLAENRDNDTHPFSFLATYANRITSSADIGQLSLEEAFREYGKSDPRLLRNLLAPVESAGEDCPLASRLLSSGEIFRSPGWTPAQALPFIEAIPELEAAGIIVKVPDWWEGGQPPRAQVQVTLDTAERAKIGAEAMMAFSLDIAVGDLKLSPEEWTEIRMAYGGSGLVSIKGRWVRVDPDRLQGIIDNWRELGGGGDAISFHEGLRLLARGEQAEQVLPELGDDNDFGGGDWIRFIASSRLRETLAALRNPSGGTSEAAAFADLKATLRPYQADGFRWLQLMHGLGLGACLADDMGLGKTLQVIAMLLHIRNTAPQFPALVVVPASLIGSWRSELKKFAPSLETFFAHPSQCGVGEMEAFKEAPAFAAAGNDLVVITYGMLARTTSVREAKWGAIILDEAQAIKNPRTDQSIAVRELEGTWRLAMSGTPVENNLGDLWSLFDFLNPGLLGSAMRFKEAIRSMEGISYEPLRNLVSPYILRRLKTDRSIISDLPEKTEMRADCPLSKQQARLYQGIVSQLQYNLKRDDMSTTERRGIVLASLTRLKQICDHPALRAGAGTFTEEDSGKFSRLRALSEEISACGEKVIVFTQFREMCAPLADFLTGIFGRPGLVLHGGTPVAKRTGLVEKFQGEDGPPFFVISLMAGGTGLTLTAASHVIHFDRWWNPAVENQATDRAFRIGQKRPVLVHKFVCPGTVEEKIDQLITEKRELADEVLGNGQEIPITEMDDQTLLNAVRLDINASVW